jgi:hypothetical protein
MIQGSFALIRLIAPHVAMLAGHGVALSTTKPLWIAPIPATWVVADTAILGIIVTCPLIVVLNPGIMKIAPWMLVDAPQALGGAQGLMGKASA